MKIRIAVQLLAGAALIVACFDNPAAPSASRSAVPRAHRLAAQRGRPQTIDDEFAAIAAAESTFGGAILDSMQVPVVFLTNTSRLATARAAGVDAFLSRRKISTGNIRVLPAAYGFGALKRWYDCAEPLVLGLQDAVFTDIDEAHNRLNFGVATPSARGDVQAFGTQCGIPSEAVAVDVVPRVGLKSGGLNETVQDSVRPLRGGIKISFYGAESPCTLGIIGRYNDDSLAFLTAAHCSNTGTGDQDTTSYWQPTVGNADSIGREAVDPAFFSCTAGGYTGQLCRYSDVNLSFLHSTATAKQGFIALTESPSFNPAYAGSIALDTTYPGRFVTATASYAPACGTILCKTGQISGTTCGAVRGTDTDVRIGGGSTKWLKYQTRVHAHVDNGDSGSPVYLYHGDSTVTFEGILWGGQQNTDTTFYFSTWDWIAYELFPNHDGFDVLNLYAYLRAVLSGPSSIGVTDTYEWNATTYGGTGSKSYQWAYQNVGSSTWTSLGTYSYQDRLVYDTTTDFTIRVTVTTSGSDTASQDLFVDVNPITSLDLSGTSWTHPGIICTWTATPTGGDSPYTYEWPGNVVHTTDGPDTWSWYTSEGWFRISVTVTAANGSQASNLLDVYIDEGGPGC